MPRSTRYNQTSHLRLELDCYLAGGIYCGGTSPILVSLASIKENASFPKQRTVRRVRHYCLETARAE